MAKDLMMINEEFLKNYQSSSSSAEMLKSFSMLTEMEMAVRLTIMGGKLDRNA
jgi:hypothetical protein